MCTCTCIVVLLMIIVSCFVRILGIIIIPKVTSFITVNMFKSYCFSHPLSLLMPSLSSHALSLLTPLLSPLSLSLPLFSLLTPSLLTPLLSPYPLSLLSSPLPPSLLLLVCSNYDNYLSIDPGMRIGNEFQATIPQFSIGMY